MRDFGQMSFFYKSFLMLEIKFITTISRFEFALQINMVDSNIKVILKAWTHQAESKT